MGKVILIVSGGTVVNAILVPAGATITASGDRVVWDGDGIDAPEGARFEAGPDGSGIGWTVVDGQWSPPPSTTVQPVDLLAYAADKRWQVETGGITVGGVPMATDRESQSLITGAHAYVLANPDVTIKFKAANGFVDLDAATVTAVATAVAAHVQACFAAEAEVAAAIQRGDILTLGEVDAWPWP